MKIVLINFCCLSFLLPNLFSQGVKQNGIDNGFHDTNTYTILSFKEFKTRLKAFDSSSLDTDLSTVEIAIVENLFFKGIDEYNNRVKKQVESTYKTEKEKKEALDDFLIPILKGFYIKQLIPIINPKGQKLVYINCFGGDPSNKEYFWKNELIQVMDGGNGFFQLIINISTKTIISVRINDYG